VNIFKDLIYSLLPIYGGIDFKLYVNSHKLHSFQTNKVWCWI